MGKKSKPKGGRGEREVCRILSEAFGAPFIRSANSGAYVGGTNAGRKAHLDEGQIRGLKGDIVPPDTVPRMVIECKLYADFAYHQFLSGKPIAQLDDWLDQARQCVDPEDFWFLTFRADRREWAIAIDHAHVEHLNLPDTHIVYRDGNGDRYLVCHFVSFVERNLSYMADQSR